MKKKMRCVILSYMVITALLLGVFMEIPFGAIHSPDVQAQSSESTDGVYTIEGKLWHATMDQPSMGNSAVIQPMKIIKDGDSIMLQLEFQYLTSGVFSGYLYGFYYFPTWGKEETPDGTGAVSVTVTDYYDIYDDYNRPSTGLDDKIKGKFYPHTAIMPITWNAVSTWVQVYVPVMETISAGSGTQYARLLLDWDTLKKTEEKVEDIITTPAPGASENMSDHVTSVPEASSSPDTGDSEENKSTKNTGNKKLDINSLNDGTYTITGKMLKTDKKNSSMANEAIDHNVTLKVKKGKYSLILHFSGLKVGNSKGYLSKLRYFKTGYQIDKNGVPTGNTAAVTVNAYQKDSSGKRLSDSYGTDYPAKVTFTMIPEAKKDGYVPLQVFVPIMEAISAGTGTQAVYLKLDLSSIRADKSSKTTKSQKNSTGKKSSTDSGKKKSTSSKSKGNSSSNTKHLAKGNVYSCQIVPCYKHPVTGKVEDSGGESSYATGQGMVESVLAATGMLEETESKAYYLTMRFKLMDFTSGHKFWVQNRGETDWKSESQVVVTQTGSDKNGKMEDLCIPVPGKDSIVKVSMFVEPMGRNVVFYAYPKNLKKGKPSDMEATKVSTNNKNADSATVGKTEEAESGDKEDLEDTSVENNNTEDILTYSSEGLNAAQGLSLSTVGADLSSLTDGTETESGNIAGGMSFGKWVIALTASITLSGILLMMTGAGLVYYFRRNWHRWGEEVKDDED